MTTELDNVLHFPGRRGKDIGPAAMSLWFQRLGRAIGKTLRIKPNAFLVVLITDDDMDIYMAGPTHLLDDAGLAAYDQRRHQRLPQIYDPPEEMRAGRRTLAYRLKRED